MRRHGPWEGPVYALGARQSYRQRVARFIPYPKRESRGGARCWRDTCYVLAFIVDDSEGDSLDRPSSRLLDADGTLVGGVVKSAPGMPLHEKRADPPYCRHRCLRNRSSRPRARGRSAFHVDRQPPFRHGQAGAARRSAFSVADKRAANASTNLGDNAVRNPGTKS